GAGSVSCSIASNDLTCTASGGPVTIGQSTGAFDVSFTATPSAVGSFVNPRSGGTCAVDPGGLITEAPGASTSCSDTVVVPDNPSVQLTTPPDGVSYHQGQTVKASYKCTESALGPGIRSCSGPVPDGSAIDTSTVGQHSFTVTATSKDGLTATVTHHYSIVAIGPPTATITSPADNRIFTKGRSVATSFSCAESASGPGIRSCTDSNGTHSPTGRLDTSHTGKFAYTVTAISKDGLTATTTIHYKVVPHRTRPRVTHLKVHRNGIVTFDVIVPSAGIIKVLETASKHDEQPRGAAAAALLRPARGRFAFARARRTLQSAGTFHMRVAPSKRGKRLVAHHRHPVHIRLWVTFKPPNGHVFRFRFFGLFITK
ncbi:MAG TPA: hypothetical protein VGF70_06015, partial [Solirubrobacteraceae bacterium]